MPGTQPILRAATVFDAARICEVFIRSVREICAPDYGNDPEILDSWCANKTLENVAQWIQNPDNFFIVVELHPHGIVGAAMYKRSEASIYLCYVIPEGLDHGIGSKMLAAMEAEAKRLGHVEILLDSSITAQDFYTRHGYVADRLWGFWEKVKCFPMRKHLRMNAGDLMQNDDVKELEEGTSAAIDFTRLGRLGAQGQTVVPVAIQNADSLEMLYIGYVNERALLETLRTRQVVLWSTSRNSLWHKGATSGDFLNLVDVRVNCEQNSLLFLVRPVQKGACHTHDAQGNTRSSCYYRRIILSDGSLHLQYLDDVPEQEEMNQQTVFITVALIALLALGCAETHSSNTLQGIVRAARVDDLSQIERIAQMKFAQYSKYQPLYYMTANDSAARHIVYLQGQIEAGKQIMLVHESAGRIDGFLMANLVTPPPVYDQSLHTLMIDDFYLSTPSLWPSVGSALIAEAERLGKLRGAIQVVAVSGTRDDAKNKFLELHGLTSSAVWYTSPLNGH